MLPSRTRSEMLSLTCSETDLKKGSSRRKKYTIFHQKHLLHCISYGAPKIRFAANKRTSLTVFLLSTKSGVSCTKMPFCTNQNTQEIMGNFPAASACNAWSYEKCDSGSNSMSSSVLTFWALRGKLSQSH